MIEPEMKKINPRIGKMNSKIIALLSILLLSLTITGWLVVNHQLLPVDPNNKTVIEVRVPDNSSAREIAALLKQNGLIRNEKVFLAYCREKGLDKQLKVGLYTFSKSQSLKELALQISQGKVVTSSFTVPEGYTVKQIGELLVQRKICTQVQWAEALKANYNYDFIGPPTSDNEKRMEGFLFPDTYTIDENVSAQDIVKMMLERFSKVWNEEFAGQAGENKLSVRDAVIVASLIEREAKISDERKRVSGVIYNRLQKGMALELCATVIYSLGEPRETVTYKDLEVNSPYNTYKHVGLPPGPIASPGKASIDAAINPEHHSYYYYLAKGDGSHYFSTTYSEHLAAKVKYGL